MSQRSEKRKRRLARFNEMRLTALKELLLYGDTFVERKNGRVVSVGRQMGKSLMWDALYAESMKEKNENG